MARQALKLNLSINHAINPDHYFTGHHIACSVSAHIKVLTSILQATMPCKNSSLAMGDQYTLIQFLCLDGIG